MVEPKAEAVTNALLWSALQERNQVGPAVVPKGSMRPSEPDRPPSWMTPTDAVQRQPMQITMVTGFYKVTDMSRQRGPHIESISWQYRLISKPMLDVFIMV